MRIPGDISKISGIYGNRSNTGKVDKAGPVSAKNDVLSISNEAKEFQSVYSSLKNVPDIRTDKVNEITKSIETGNYNVRGRDVADKVINAVFDKKA